MPRYIETGDEQRAKARADEEHAFAHWLREVDGHLVGALGLSHRDLPDQTWRDWFDDQLDPGEAAQLCLDNEGLDIELEA